MTDYVSSTHSIDLEPGKFSFNHTMTTRTLKLRRAAHGHEADPRRHQSHGSRQCYRPLRNRRRRRRLQLCGADRNWDVDILIAFDPGHRLQTGLITLGPILSYLKDKG